MEGKESERNNSNEPLNAAQHGSTQYERTGKPLFWSEKWFPMCGKGEEDRGSGTKKERRVKPLLLNGELDG